MDYNRKRRRKRRPAAVRSHVTQALLLFLCVATFAVPLLTTGGTAFSKPVTAQAAGGAYDSIALELAGATAFDDARKAASDGEDADYQTFLDNLNTLTSGTRWGNVGIFVGPKGTSQSMDNYSSLFSKVNVNKSQIENYGDAFIYYKAFGTAVQNLNEDAKKGKGSSYALQEGVSAIQSAAGKLTNLGTELLKAYNPAPLVWALIEYDEVFVTGTYGIGHTSIGDNQLVAFVNGNDGFKGFLSVMGRPFIGPIPFTFVVAAFLAILLLITSVVLTLINGRSAGENIRKAVVKIVISCLGVPLLCSLLGWGINLLDETSLNLGSQVENTYVRQNLNLADWYATYFSLPDGLTIPIDENGDFVLTEDAVYAINKFTYETVTDESFDAEKEMARMEELFNSAQSSPMAVSFSEPIRKSDQRPWKTTNYYAILNNFGSNTENLTDGIEGADDESNLVNVGYLTTGSLSIASVGDVDGVAYYVTGSGSDYGISPIAATNLMRTTFTGSGMTVSSNETIGPVAVNADNATIAGSDDGHMNGFVELLATFSIVMAAIKGLFTIITAGFGGIIGGSTKSAMGMSTGVGQAIGGILALVGGVFGIGLIMTISLTLLGQIYHVLKDLIMNGIGPSGVSLLAPIADVVNEIPVVGPDLARDVRNIGSCILLVIAMFTLPKFGGIPVTLFCQAMAELPHRFAAEAQQIENKFTGDFRAGGGIGGGGAMGGATTLINQASNQAGAQIQQMGQGAVTIAGALGGFGLTKLGERMEKSADKDHTDSLSDHEESSEEVAPEAPEEGMAGMPEEAVPGTEPQEQAEGAEGAEPATDAESVGDDPDPDAPNPESGTDGGKASDTRTSIQGGTVNQAEGDVLDGDTLNGKEETEETVNSSDQQVQSEEQNDQETDSEERQISDKVGENATMSQDQASTENTSQDTGNTEMLNHTENTSQDTGNTEMLNNAENLQDTTMVTDMQDTENTDTSAEATASLNSHSDHMTENLPGSMADKEGGKAQAGETGKAPAGETGKTRAATPQAGAAKAGEMGTGRSRSMSGNSGGAKSSSGISEKGAKVKEQNSKRLTRSVAKALQAAGGHTSLSDAMAGVAAGTVHTVGSAVGAGNLTQNAVNAVRQDRARRMDIARGIDPAIRRQRQTNQNRNRNTGAKDGTVKSPGSQSGAGTPQVNQDAIRNVQMAQEENYRQQAEADAARRDPRS